jgi:putative two-component system response regulator
MIPLPTVPASALVVAPADHAASPAAHLARVVLAAGRTHCAHVHSPAEALRYLRDKPGVDVVLIVPGPTADRGVSLCRSIKFDVRTTFVPVVFILEDHGPEIRAAAYEAGADDCIGVAATPREVALRLSRVVRAKQATDSMEDATTVIAAMAATVEARDGLTCGHVERVTSYCVEIGRRLEVGEAGLSALRRGAVVHDIGKVVVPDHVLNKPGALTDEEMALVRRHPVVGHDILQPLRSYHDVLPIVRWHHERPNGTGYPDGLAGDDLPLLPRIVAVADSFDALSTDRPYRSALPLQSCRDALNREAESGILDPAAVQALLEILNERFCRLDQITTET